MRLAAALMVLAGGCAWGQAPAQQAVLQFLHTQSIQDFQEISNMIRTIGDFGPAATNNDQRTLTLSGTAEQIALAEWIFKQLDTGAPPQTPDPLYKAGDNDVVQVFFLTKISSIQEFQEIANAVRTTTEIRRAFTENSQRALAMRGSPDQIAMAEWLIQGLDRTGGSTTDEYQAGVDDVVRMFRLTYAVNVQNFQEIANLVRTISGIRRAFTVNPQTALAVRGTKDQMAMASWLLGELEKHDASSHEYRAGVDDVVHVFYLTGARTEIDFQAAANRVRTASGVKQAFAENAQRALAIRGTAEQIKTCEQVVQGLGL